MDKQHINKIEKIYRCQKTLVELIRTRGFNIPISYDNITLQQTKIQYELVNNDENIEALDFRI